MPRLCYMGYQSVLHYACFLSCQKADRIPTEDGAWRGYDRLERVSVDGVYCEIIRRFLALYDCVC